MSTTTNQYQCCRCGKLYKSKSTLNYHEFTHAEERKFVCTFSNCVKAFKSSKRLAEHKRTHNAIARFVCEFCGYCTRVRCNFLVHRRIHTGEKPYSCLICAKAFVSLYQLAQHKLAHIHKEQRLFKCEKCSVTFSSPKCLYHHRALHANTKQYACPICGNCYAQAAGMSQHMRRQHKEKNKRATRRISQQTLCNIKA